MSNYVAPITEMRFVMDELAGFKELSALPGFDEATADLADAVVEEGGRFANEVLAPLNWSGDQAGATWNDTVVTTAPGWREAYQQFCDGGWNGIGSSTEFGGQGLPQTLSIAVKEAVCSANLSFSLGPLLTTGAIEAIERCASEEVKHRFLPKMISGEWTGTMNLTEPQAGSDLALLRSRAEPQADGTYRVFGQKIFITYGEHDMTDNIIHLVLARLPDAPAGVKGISLFVVPKFMVNDDGSLGARNDVHCVSLEHKLGIHASPTCVMAFGDKGGATGYLVGQANRGLEYMFIMMNEARLGVGLQGVAIGERAYQQAVAYAKERVQGRDALTGENAVAIIRHPEIRRSLLSMRSRVEAARAICYLTAGLLDRARNHGDEAERARNLALAEFLIPIAKGWSTETGIDVASLGIQVHGGMGFIEETGAAQHLRDARITTIYEGTTGIQANDLIFRKLLRDQGATAQALFGQVEQTIGELNQADDEALRNIGARLGVAAAALAKATQWIAANVKSDVGGVLTGAVSYLYLAGIVCGGWQMARAAQAAKRQLAAGEGNSDFLTAKLHTASFYAEQILPQARAYAETITNGGASTLAMPEGLF